MASGKSRVRELLAAAGIETIDADEVGHMLLEPDGAAFGDVSRRWPEVVLEGRVDRSSLARIVFSDTRQLAALEEMTHPHIFDMIRGEVEEIEGPVVVEMPLPGRRLGEEWRQLVVDCRDEVKIERAIARGMEGSDARARLGVQPSREEWLATADVVIPNHGTMADLVETVGRLVDTLEMKSQADHRSRG